jgi:hypothetical protein
MAKTKISEFNANPALNTDIDSINIAEGCAPSGINDAIRELMSQLKDFQAGTAGDSFNGPVGTSTAAAGAFTTLSASGAVTLSGGTANGVAYLNGSKVLTSGSALTFDGTNFGVGLSNPSAYGKFVVSGSANVIGGNYLYLWDSGNTNAPGMYAPGDSIAWKNSAGSTEWMRINGTGLGIGTSSPDSKLHVVSGASSTLAQLRIGYNGTSVNYYDANTHYFRDGSGPTNRMIIDSSGNLGLGVTPSAWFTGGGYKVMQIGPAMAFDSGTDYRARIAANGFVNSAGDWKYLNTGFASNYSQVSGQHQFYTAASGTAGNTITFTQAMTLDASGNLLLGTTTAIGKATIYKAGTGYSDSLVLSNDAAYGANQGIAWGSSTNISGRIKGVDDGAYGTNLTFETRTGGPSTTTTERARIDSSGTFLFGRTGADVGTNGFRIDPSGSTYASIATGNETSYVYSTSASAYRFYVNAAGTVFATNTTISAISDIRYKENVRDLDAGLAKVMALKPRLYDWKEGKGADIKNARGFIAQEFETVFPDLIDEWKDPAPEGEEPYKSVRQDLIPVLVKAIQEQQAIIESLKSRLDAANL